MLFDNAVLTVEHIIIYAALKFLWL